MRNPRERESLRLLVAVAAGAAAHGLAAADTLFVSSFGGGEIVRYDLPSNLPIPIVSGIPLPEDGACSPTSGRIYFALANSSELWAWNPDGSSALNIIPAAGSVMGPEGPTFDGAGNLYFNTRQIGAGTQGAWLVPGGDPANPASQIVTPYTSFGEGADVVAAGPHAGALLLAARGEQRVMISEPLGSTPVTLIPDTAFPPLSALFGITTDGCGDIFVAFAPQGFTGVSEVHRFDPEGGFIEVYASGLQRAGFLEFDGEANLFVADNVASVVHRIEPDRTDTAFATVFDALGVAICRGGAPPGCVALACDAGGPYREECQGGRTCLKLDGSASEERRGGQLQYAWSSSCPGASFDDPASPTPELCVDSSAAACELSCEVTLRITNGVQSTACSAPVSVTDTLPPSIGCALQAAKPPSGASSPASWQLLPPQAPRAPRLAGTASSSSSGFFEVVCGVVDACDADPDLDARLLVTRTQAETCTEQVEELGVACGEIVGLARLAKPCQAKPPRSPRPTLSVRSDGLRVFSGERIVLEVRAKDACGNEAAACRAEAELAAPKPAKCARSCP